MGSNSYIIMDLFTLFVLLLFASSSYAEANDSHFYNKHNSPEVRLLRRIRPNDHAEASARPVQNSSTVVVLHTWTAATQIISVDEREQTITLAMWIVFKWQNEFVKWNPADFGGLTEVTVPTEYVWLPDVGLSNSVEAQYDFGASGTEFARCRIDYKGRTTWYPNAVMKFACNLDMTYFPFDTQSCQLGFESFTFKREVIDFHILDPKMGLGGYIENGAWELVDAPVTKTYTIYAGKNHFARLNIDLHLKRKSLFYSMNIILPCVIISVLVILVFWLPPEAGEKVSLGITILLAFSVFQLLIADMMPRTSDSQPILVVYVSTLMFLSMMSIILSVLVLNMHHFQGIHRPPKWLRNFIFNGVAKIVLAEKFVPPDYFLNSNLNNTPTPEDVKLNHNTETEDLSVGNGQMKMNIKKILEHLEEIKLHDEHDNPAQREWKALAVICDRFFMFLTILATILATVICFVILTTQAHQYKS